MFLAHAAALLCASAALADVDPGPVAPALSADQIAQKNLAARGGADMWHQVHALGFQGTMEVPPPPTGPRRPIIAQEPAQAAQSGKQAAAEPPKTLKVPFLMAMRRPHQMRLEIQFHGQVAAQVFDGRQGWLVSGAPGQWSSQAFTPEHAKAAAEQEDLDGPLIDYASKGSQIELEGTDSVDGHRAYRVRLVTAGGVERHIWIDSQTFLDAKVDGIRQINGKVRPVSIFFRDYRPAEGLMIARTIETRAQGLDETETIHIDAVAVNPALDDGTFRKPK
jgi:hypothetical protein